MPSPKPPKTKTPDFGPESAKIRDQIIADLKKLDLPGDVYNELAKDLHWVKWVND